MNIANNNCGWASRMPYFRAASTEEVVNSLVAFVTTSTPEQMRAWKASVPALQSECGAIVDREKAAAEYGAVLEYELPDSLKRPDAILLVSGAVLVVEFKGDGNEDQAFLEQVADYSRRLYWYHTLCGDDSVVVHSLLVAYGQEGLNERRDWITLTNMDRLHEVVASFDRPQDCRPIPVEEFIDPGVCQPSPSLVQAVREYFAKNALPRIKRVDAITGSALRRVIAEIHETHDRRRRKLVLLSGVPGAGKTYVGMQIAHDAFIDDLAEPMPSGEKPTAPAVFLSGNKPLVDVLQYEMRRAGGGGRVFVRGVKEFIRKYSSARSGPPPHHVLIFDEAQRAWDAERVKSKHGDRHAPSEPEAFVSFASRVPGWSVVLGLIGEGQVINTGEEGGIELWADAVSKVARDWDVCGPVQYRKTFADRGIRYEAYDELHLAKSVRFHFAAGLSEWATGIVDSDRTPAELKEMAAKLSKQGYQIRLTRNLDLAKRFLWEKYRDHPEARFGLMTSARDKGLKQIGVEARDTRFFNAGPWYADPESSPNSCRRLIDAITEFSAQGLELDHSLLVWGTDFTRVDGHWDDSLAMRFQKKNAVRDRLQLRRNAYRVLLTRGREGVVICVPAYFRELDATFDFFAAAGCELLA